MLILPNSNPAQPKGFNAKMSVSRQSATVDNNQQDIPLPEPLVQVTRGALTESRHRGHVVAAEPDGRVVASLGAPETVTFLRSSAKPHQAIPLVASGAADRFGFSEKEIALACASHSGEPIHTETAHSMLRKIGLKPGDLKCGIHDPFSPEVARALHDRGEKPNVLQNNCSGKHAGMLALAKFLGAPIETYERPDNPVQLAIGETISQFSGIAIEDIAVAVDGCGVPVFGVTVKAMALMYARLVATPQEFEEPTREACKRIVSAMTKYPEIIGGTADRLDTEMMRATGGTLISKVGAEGVYTAGVLPCDEWPKGLGLALKIEDGDDHRARPTVVIESLNQLGVLNDQALEAVSKYAFFAVRNRLEEVVGEVRASFKLDFDNNQRARSK
jgi:L-asparaginase II